MSQGTLGCGSTLNIGGTTVSEVTNIGLPEIDSDEIDVTTHNDTDRVRNYEKGLIDPGSLAIEGNLNYDEYAVFYEKVYTSSLQSVTITLPTTPSVTKFEANAFVKSLSGESPYDDKITFSSDLRISGKPTLTEV